MARKSSTKIRRLTIESSGDTAALICGAGECDRPFLVIEDGEVKFLSKHGNAQHENILTRDHLKMILLEIDRQLQPYQQW